MYNIVATKQGKIFFPKQNTMPQDTNLKSSGEQ